MSNINRVIIIIKCQTKCQRIVILYFLFILLIKANFFSNFVSKISDIETFSNSFLIV